MTHPNTIVATILHDIEAAELWWRDIATKHGVTHQLVQALGWATQPYAVMLCTQCSGSGKNAEAACKACGGEGWRG